MTTKQQPRSLWPFAIIGFFICAMISLAIFIGWAVRQNVDLVRKDYYADEVRFQEQLDRLQRTQQRGANAEIVYDEKLRSITLTLPQFGRQKPTFGRVHLYRPSDASLDRNARLSFDSQGKQQLDARGLKSGLWKVRLQWKVSGEEFYSEKSIIITTDS